MRIGSSTGLTLSVRLLPWVCAILGAGADVGLLTFTSVYASNRECIRAKPSPPPFTTREGTDTIRTDSKMAYGKRSPWIPPGEWFSLDHYFVPRAHPG